MKWDSCASYQNSHVALSRVRRLFKKKKGKKEEKVDIFPVRSHGTISFSHGKSRTNFLSLHQCCGLKVLMSTSFGFCIRAWRAPWTSASYITHHATPFSQVKAFCKWPRCLIRCLIPKPSARWHCCCHGSQPASRVFMLRRTKWVERRVPHALGLHERS